VAPSLCAFTAFKVASLIETPGAFWSLWPRPSAAAPGGWSGPDRGESDGKDIRRSQSGRCSTATKHDVGMIMRESMQHEAVALLYKELLTAAEGRSVMLEE
jgi:hypothetical protein